MVIPVIETDTLKQKSQPYTYIWFIQLSDLMNA